MRTKTLKANNVWNRGQCLVLAGRSGGEESGLRKRCVFVVGKEPPPTRRKTTEISVNAQASYDGVDSNDSSLPLAWR